MTNCSKPVGVNDDLHSCSQGSSFLATAGLIDIAPLGQAEHSTSAASHPVHPVASRRRAVLATVFLAVLLALASLCPQVWADDVTTNLPDGVRALWEVTKAYHETTPTRERICLNGLWRWQPADVRSDHVPAGSWGFFKVPGCWPGITDYMQKDSQTLYAHPSWKDVKPGGITAAWYERELSVPSNWADRRISLNVEYLNSYAAVFVDGVRKGEIYFPGGEVDLSAACGPVT